MFNSTEHISKQATAAALGLLLVAGAGGFMAGRQSLTKTESPEETTTEVADNASDGTPDNPAKPYSRITETQNHLTDTTKYLLKVVASEPGYNSIGVREDAEIIIRCEAGNNELYISTPEYLSSDSQTIQLRWNDGTLTSEYWTGSSQGTGLFSNSPISILQKLNASDRLVIGYKPWRSPATSAVFSLEEYREDLKQMLEHCK